MCFYIHPKHKRAKTAKQDIICYKRFRRGKKYFISPYRKFKFEKGECYYEDSIGFNVDFFGVTIITRGLHSYSSLEQAKTKRLHFGSRLEKIVRCVIPEGAIYYFNPEDKEYVSDYLIIGTDEDIISLKNEKI